METENQLLYTQEGIAKDFRELAAELGVERPTRIQKLQKLVEVFPQKNLEQKLEALNTVANWLSLFQIDGTQELALAMFKSMYNENDIAGNGFEEIKSTLENCIKALDPSFSTNILKIQNKRSEYN